MDSSTFGSLPDGADLLAVVGGHRYLSVAWVMRQAPNGCPEYYCPLLDWPETPAAQLASRDATIATLQARVACLEARLRGQEALPAPIEAELAWRCARCRRGDIAPGLHSVAICMLCEAAPTPDNKQRTTDNEHPTPDRKLPAGRAQCPYCPKTPWANQLADHLSTAHPEQLAMVAIPVAPEPEEEPTPPAAPIAVTPDDPTWSCGRCQSNAHARSLRDPALCQRCAAMATTINGHVAAA